MCSQLPDTQPLESIEYSKDAHQEGWGVLYSINIIFKKIVMTKNEYSIGRHPSCDVVLEKEKSVPESDTSVNPDSLPSNEGIRIGVPESTLCTFSKLHFKISREMSVVFLEDFSSNGTYVNGTLVGKNKKVILQNNDQISLASQNNKVYVFVDNSSYSRGMEFLNYPSEIMDNFVISRNLGKGAYGEVMLVFNKKTSMRLAMKVVQKKTLNCTPDSIMNEVEIMRVLNHPCVLSIHNVVDSPKKLFIFMPFMEGGDLYDIVKSRGKLSEDLSKWFFYQITKAVEYLHGQGIAHRDLKPENILLSCNKDSAIIKLSDFGLSRIFNEEMVMKTFCGTLFYIAPEVLETRGRGSYTNQVDVWSIGVMLYLCLGGGMPFNVEREDLSLCQQILSGSYSFPRRNWEGVNRTALDLISRMMTVNPKLRIAVNMIPSHAWFQDRNLMGKLRAQNLFQEADENEPPPRRQRLTY